MSRGKYLVELTGPQIEALCSAVVDWEANHQPEPEGWPQPDRREAPTMERAYRALRRAIDPPPLPMTPPPELNRTAG